MPDVEWVTWCNGEQIGGCWAVATEAGIHEGYIGLLFDGPKPEGLWNTARLTIKAHTPGAREIDVWVRKIGHSLVTCSLTEPSKFGRPPKPRLLDFLRHQT